MAPEIVAGPMDATYLQGDMGVLDCAAVGIPSPDIKWLKDGTTIPIIAVMHNGNSKQDHQVFISVPETMCYDAESFQEFYFTQEPIDVIVLRERPATLNCSAHGQPKPTIAWKRDGVLLDLSGDNRRAYIPEPAFHHSVLRSVRFMKVLADTIGGLSRNTLWIIIACVAGVIFIAVLVLSLVLWRRCYTRQKYTKPGFGAHVHAHTSTHPRSSGSGGARSAQMPNSNLTDYAGVIPGSRPVPSAPRDLSAVVLSSRFVKLTWRVPTNTYGPVLTYSVFYRQEGSDRERVHNVTDVATAEAEISDLLPGTPYIFRVIAYNVNGPGDTSATISIHTQPEVHLPGAPRSVRVRATSPYSMRITWQPPEFATGNVTGYRISYSEVDSDAENIVDVKLMEQQFLDLKAYTEYIFRVMASNRNGIGVSSPEIIAKTYTDTPSDTPVNVTLDVQSSTSIVVSWHPPPAGTRNGIITGYKIRYKRRGGKRGETVTTDGNRRVYALEQLQRGAPYAVRISAMTVNGTGPATDWLVAETFTNDLDESTVPGEPESIQLRATDTTITVTWAPPRDRTVMVRTYTIGYGISVPDVYEKVLDTKNQRAFTIEHLRPQSMYIVSIRANNNVGPGPPAYETIHTQKARPLLPETPLDPPHGLRAEVLSPNSVVLMWDDHTLPVKTKHAIDGRIYTIRYRTGGGRFKYQNSTDLTTVTDGLTPNTQYEFSVKVTKGRRSSAYSMVIFNVTQEDTPHTAPRDLTIVPVENNPTAINLNWQPPKVPNGQITGNHAVVLVGPAVKPQPVNSPYKKPTVIVNSTPSSAQASGSIYNKPRMSPMPVVMPRAPDGGMLPADFRPPRAEDPEKINNDAPNKSSSIEDISQEITNLESLVKDLNAITASEFEC
ncbi:PREDICTED: neogenin-like [Priapulus caudatus]|uniref:Neogenin-like n=1 Tax=Priapulus caudatus TaxID=37621 RepID=A0ABM1DYW5_PRICU|nr:PREDICTED: neogenin-like [Priapulus caudatus]